MGWGIPTLPFKDVSGPAQTGIFEGIGGKMILRVHPGVQPLDSIHRWPCTINSYRHRGYDEHRSDSDPQIDRRCPVSIGGPAYSTAYLPTPSIRIPLASSVQVHGARSSVIDHIASDIRPLEFRPPQATGVSRRREHEAVQRVGDPGDPGE